MLLQCQSCSKVKKFGEWIEIPEGLRELMKEIRIIPTLCPHCQGMVVSMTTMETVAVK